MVGGVLGIGGDVAPEWVGWLVEVVGQCLFDPPRIVANDAD